MTELSILIPSFNCGKYLMECLNSILSQSYEDYEIIIVDDGSTDDTFQVLSLFQDSRLKYIRLDTNVGVAKASNIGLKFVTGEFVARMDADDIMIGNRLQEQVEYLRANSLVGMVGSWYQVMDLEGRLIDLVRPTTDKMALALLLLFRNQFAQSAVTIRADLIKSLRYDETLTCCEDYDLWLRVSRMTEIAIIDSYHVIYRWHPGNTSNRLQAQVRENAISLSSRELDNIGVDHSHYELMLHASTMLATPLISKQNKTKEIIEWYDKILSSNFLIARYGKVWLDYFRNSILMQELYPWAHDWVMCQGYEHNKEGITKSKQNESEIPRITIITVVKNMAATIERTIKSVIRQEYENLQYIVIDGASSDGTIDLVKQYENEIDYFVSEKDYGIAAAFNKGLKLADGNIIGFINADDWLEPGSLRALAEAFLEYPTFDVYYGKTRITPSNETDILVPEANSHFLLPYGMTISHPSTFVSQNAYENFGIFDNRYKIAMDYELLLRFLSMGATFKFLDCVLANFTPGGKSFKESRLAQLETSQVRQKIISKVFQEN